VERRTQTVNSYLGAMVHCSSYALRRKALEPIMTNPAFEVRSGCRSIARRRNTSQSRPRESSKG
jgi:hypothetical protein